MSFYDDASLVVIPSGYKTSKVYSVKPTDGSGDLTFSRSNDTATRVASNGLIERVRTNLILQSETFSNASWGKTTATITANTTTAPNGTTTADTFDATSNFGFISQSPTLASGSLATYSVYIKNIDAPYVNLQIRTTVTAGLARFDFTGATLTGSTLTTGISANFTDVGSGWYRCTLTCTTSEANQQYRIQLPNSGDSVFVWGAMAEVGDVMTDYIATTSAAVSVGPVANVPRLDYLNSSCPRLLLEPQRTNLITYSEQFNNAAWTKSGSGTGSAAVVTANYGISPDGYANADRVQLNKGAGTLSSDFSLIQQTITSVTTGTSSIWMKSADGNNYTVALRSVGFILCQVTSEWQRFTYTESNMALLQLILRTTYGTSNTADILVWGAQLEAGAYATSYIPTLGAAVTRGADACSKTGISSLIGQTEGTIFVDFQLSQAPSDANGRLLQLWATNDTTNAIIPIVNQSLQLQITTFGASAGTAIISAGPSTLLGLGQNKIAVAYTSTSVVVYRNGVLFASGNPTGFFPTSLTSLDLGGSSFAARNLGNPINQALLFKTRLTNAQLAELTTI